MAITTGLQTGRAGTQNQGPASTSRRTEDLHGGLDNLNDETPRAGSMSRRPSWSASTRYHNRHI
jgi:hypothetical protein